MAQEVKAAMPDDQRFMSLPELTWRKREMSPTNCPMTLPCEPWHIQTHTEREDKSINKCTHVLNFIYFHVYG